ncbi:fimbrial protein [Atlantibacter sp.]|uniref:fimbrial protein n=1 Tax=Atlantibacter sp. TaxID=1903473 RepID=UPI0028B1AB62|nr:fimbrial protein [Atlantibacter sp.]
MKKTLIGLTISTIFAFAAAHAEDHSAVLAINGVVTAGAESSCTVFPSTTSISLSGKANTLPLQNQSVSSVTPFTVQVSGDKGCMDKLDTNQIGVTLKGTADVNGTVLANNHTGSDAAQGVGIGIYNANGDVIKVNDNHNVMLSTGIGFGLSMVQLEGQTPTAGLVHGSLTIEIERL